MCRNKLGLAVGLVVLAMLASRPVLGWYVRHRPDFQTRWRMTAMKKAVAAYQSSHQGRCPLSLAQLQLETRVDGWEQPVIFVCPGVHDQADFISAGADHIFGTTDDMVSW